MQSWLQEPAEDLPSPQDDCLIQAANVDLLPHDGRSAPKSSLSLRSQIPLKSQIQKLPADQSAGPATPRGCGDSVRELKRSSSIAVEELDCILECLHQHTGSPETICRHCSASTGSTSSTTACCAAVSSSIPSSTAESAGAGSGARFGGELTSDLGLTQLPGSNGRTWRERFGTIFHGWSGQDGGRAHGGGRAQQRCSTCQRSDAPRMQKLVVAAAFVWAAALILVACQQCDEACVMQPAEQTTFLPLQPQLAQTTPHEVHPQHGLNSATRGSFSAIKQLKFLETTLQSLLQSQPQGTMPQGTCHQIPTVTVHTTASAHLRTVTRGQSSANLICSLVNAADSASRASFGHLLRGSRYTAMHTAAAAAGVVFRAAQRVKRLLVHSKRAASSLLNALIAVHTSLTTFAAGCAQLVSFAAYQQIYASESIAVVSTSRPPCSFKWAHTLMPYV